MATPVAQAQGWEQVFTSKPGSPAGEKTDNEKVSEAGPGKERSRARRGHTDDSEQAGRLLEEVILTAALRKSGMFQKERAGTAFQSERKASSGA